MKIFNFLNKKPTTKYLIDKFGEKAYIRNGRSLFGGKEEFLYDNEFIEIGFGYILSGYGDWGGGFSHASSYALKITINCEYEIQKVETDSFYNSGHNSKKVSELAEEIKDKFKVGEILIIDNDTVRSHVDEIFKLLPHDHNIGYELFDYPHMLEHYIKDHDNDVKIEKEMKEWEKQWEEEDNEKK